MEINVKWYEACELCPRCCRANRTQTGGACHTPLLVENDEIKLMLARAALHYWEEPCLAGPEGSGAVFFSGCSLGCVFCQNKDISTGLAGKYVSTDRLADIFLELQEQGAANIDLVTPTHVLPFVRDALLKVKHRLDIPVVYNTSGYDSVSSLKSVEGLIDIYMPDMKYISPILARRFSSAGDYPEVAKAALAEMFRQTGEVRLENGILKKGMLVRHLVLPGCTTDSKAVIKYLHDSFGDDIYISIMNQYTPTEKVKDMPLLKRRLHPREYEAVVDYAIEQGVSRAYVQSSESAADSFIPAFDFTGV